MGKGATVGLVILLGLGIIGYIVLDGMMQGQRGGRIYTDNTPTLGPHHWNP